MSVTAKLAQCLNSLQSADESRRGLLYRLRSELEFAAAMAKAKPEHTEEWEKLILQAANLVEEKLTSKGPIDLEAVVREAEEILAPIGKAAKEYTIHCVGHAHIDMNWMWSWPETVATTNDTFTTVNRLMEEFPTFHFSQSQASTYFAMEQHCPEVFEMIKRRVSEGRWEITANMWVEGDKNLASGEILCRHLLYTKRYFKQKFGIPYDAIKIDWEPDTFGHAHTIPSILAGAGVTRYYFCRTGPGPRLFWWQAPDGSRVLAFDDGILWYNGEISSDMTKLLFEFEKATGLKDYLFVYGVGDHGGGPTRRDLVLALEMDSWPIWPNVKLSTTDAFFSTAEQNARGLPVVNQELGFVFEGCYTSQSNIKRANRASENALAEAEAAALIARGLAGMPYPMEQLRTAWRHAMFNQFHDILPGSGVHATYEYSQGLFQEIQSITQMIKTRSLRTVASRVNTAALVSPPKRELPGSAVGPGLGAGPGDPALGTGITARGAGPVGDEPFVVFNPSPWSRTELAVAKVWDKNWPSDRIIVRDETGTLGPAQVLERGHYWGHSFITVAFPAKEIPGLGYRTYAVAVSPEKASSEGASADASGRLENEFFRVEVDQASGAIIHLIDKKTGYDFVPPGQKLGLLVLQMEAPHGMTAWEIGQIVKTVEFTEGATLEVAHAGPYRAALRSRRSYNNSKFNLEIALCAGIPRVEFTLNVDWLEYGSPQIGVPMLRVFFPTAVANGQPTYEIPCGSVKRPADGREVPALRWADLTGSPLQQSALPSTQQVGVTLLNDSKYGHSMMNNVIRLTLLRSSYDPDPLPELGSHTIRYAVVPHIGPWGPADATRAAHEFSHPFTAVGTDEHSGPLPLAYEGVAIETPSVMLSGMKRAEDSKALVLRLYEMNGQPVEARVRLDSSLVEPNSPAVETDLLEQPKPKNTARMDGNTLVVSIPAYGIVTVKIG